MKIGKDGIKPVVPVTRVNKDKKKEPWEYVEDAKRKKSDFEKLMEDMDKKK